MLFFFYCFPVLYIISQPLRFILSPLRVGPGPRLGNYCLTLSATLQRDFPPTHTLPAIECNRDRTGTLIRHILWNHRRGKTIQCLSTLGCQFCLGSPKTDFNNIFLLLGREWRQQRIGRVRDGNTHTHTPGERKHTANPQAHSQTQTFKQLDCMWGDGHWGLHKPHICLTAEISGPLTERDEIVSNNGWKMREDGQTKMRERERDHPFHVNCIISLSCPPHAHQTASYVPRL